MTKMIFKSAAATEATNSTGKDRKKKKNAKKAKSLHVIKLKRIPYGLFEKQLWEYFTQFGKVVRVRVARSLKTGNHKGWAYIGFDDKDVAEIAAETMNGYLMFEKRLGCKVMDPKNIPKCMKSGPRYLAPPHMRGRAKKEAVKRNKIKTDEQEEASKTRREKALKRRSEKLKTLGIDYEFATPASTVSSTDSKNVKADVEKVEAIEDFVPEPSSLQGRKRKSTAVKPVKPKMAKLKSKVPASKKLKKMRK